MSVPDVVIAGAAKCGTTSLAVSLNRHPEFDVGHHKEPHFFAGYERRFQGPLGGEFNATLITDVEVYEANYRDATGRATVDASPAYLARPQSAEAIAKFNPDARIIIALRNPVDRAWSAHMHLLRKGAETRSFDEALELEQDRLTSGWIPLFGHVEGSRYAPGVEAFLTQFGADQVFILRHDRYRAAPETLLAELSAFLDASSPIGSQGSHNVGGNPRSQMVNEFMRSHGGVTGAARRALGRILPASAKIRVRGAIDRANLDRSDRPSPTAREWILSRLADDIAETGLLTGYDLSDWLR